MKVVLGNYRNTHMDSGILDAWLDKRYGNDSARRFTTGDMDIWDRHVETLDKALQWVYDHTWNIIVPKYFDERKCKVRIDPWDTWNMDHTLALLIVPMLKQLKEKHHGSPSVENSDVPEELRSKDNPEVSMEHIDDNWHKRWEWVMSEMIWTFEQLRRDDWAEDFYSGDHDLQFKPIPNSNNTKLVRGPNDTFKIDQIGLDQADERIKNGLRLFGKYYRALWD